MDTNFTQTEQYAEDLRDQVSLFDIMRNRQEQHWIEHIKKTPNERWGCAMIIKNEKGEVLVGKRSEYCNEPGTWGFPGGLIEDGQEADDAVIRETIEETNLMVWEMKLVALEGNDVNDMNFIYEASSKKCSGLMKKQSSEVSELIWLSVAQLSSQFYPLFSASQDTWDAYNGKHKAKKTAFFCSGHRDITEREFDLHYKYQLEHALTPAEYGEKVEIFVGNWEGADLMIQSYLEDWYSESGLTTDITDRVTVNVCACIDSDTANTSGYFNILEGYYDWADADGYMTRNTDKDITWVRQGKEDSGSAQNIQRRVDYAKSLEFNPTFKR